MSENQKRPSISDDINALIRTSTTNSTIDRFVPAGDTWELTKEKHRVTHPPLLQQLQNTVTSSTLGATDTYTGSSGSKPPSRLDAIALLHRIQKQSREIADTIHLRRTRNLTDRLSAISGASVDQPEDTRDWITKLTRGWVISARIVTGWDAPPYAPDVPCPNIECERRGSLRIHLENQTATCIECGVYWTPETVTQLGGYVKWASDHLRGARHWLTDEDGYPLECVECLETRVQMAARKVTRQHADVETTPV